jgi:predicted PurR-regulated permease PerM
MFVVGLLTYIGLTILGIKYALPLALIAGFFEILPNIGPTLAAIPAIAVALLTVSPLMGLAVLGLYIIIQQLENNLILPYAMKKSANVNPIISILVILIGFRLGGVVFAALAIPLFLVVKIIILESVRIRKLSPESDSA